MEYCLGDGDGSAAMWTAAPDIDLNGDGVLDAEGLDFDGDGLLDDAMADLDADDVADHLVRDHSAGQGAGQGAGAEYFTDDGTGTWAVRLDPAGLLRWFGLDGIEHSGGPLIEHSGGLVVDVDADGQADDRLADSDGDGLADRAVSGEQAYVDTDGDGRWDITLSDRDADGKADGADDL